MFIESFRITGSAVAQIFLLGAIGYFLTKREILGEECLNVISRLTLNVTLPVLIFYQLVKDFSFSRYPDWWIFPLVSLGITILGLGIGFVFSWFIRGSQHKAQFVSLVAFQNSGYLPLALIAALLPAEEAGPVFIYLFLFLLGFNLAMFSLGVYILTFSRERKFELASLFSPPVIATLASLLVIFLNLNKFIPDMILHPLAMVGNCTLPLAMFVVGGSLASIKVRELDKKAMFFMTLAKLVILPLLGLLILTRLDIPKLVGLLILIELAAPAATTLSVITRHYKKEDLLVSQGIFFSHIASLVTLPLFLSLYFMRVMIK